jgi:hypothetical protein
MRSITFMAGLLCLFIGLTAHAAFPKPIKPGEEEWRKPLVAALDQVLTFEFKDMKVTSTIEFFASHTNVSFVIDPAAFPKDTPPTVSLALKDAKIKDSLSQTLAKASLTYEQRDGAIFIFNKATLQKDMLRPEELAVARLMDGREEVISIDWLDHPAGAALKELTEGPGITLAIDEAIKKVLVTVKFQNIGLGNAIRWVYRFAGGKIAVDTNGMKVVKR